MRSFTDGESKNACGFQLKTDQLLDYEFGYKPKKYSWGLGRSTLISKWQPLQDANIIGLRYEVDKSIVFLNFRLVDRRTHEKAQIEACG